MAKRTLPDDDHGDFNKTKCLMEQFQAERRAYINLNQQLQELCQQADEDRCNSDKKVETQIQSLLEAKEEQLGRSSYAFKATKEELEKVAVSPSANKRGRFYNEPEIRK